MHWLFPKKTAKATAKANAIPARPRLTRISVPRPAPKTRPRSNAPVIAFTRKTKPLPSRNSVMRLKLKKQLNAMKEITNNLKIKKPKKTIMRCVLSREEGGRSFGHRTRTRFRFKRLYTMRVIL